MRLLAEHAGQHFGLGGENHFLRLFKGETDGVLFDEFGGRAELLAVLGIPGGDTINDGVAEDNDEFIGHFKAVGVAEKDGNGGEAVAVDVGDGGGVVVVHVA